MVRREVRNLTLAILDDLLGMAEDMMFVDLAACHRRRRSCIRPP